jgi:Domain of unknown function (DUF4114)
MADIALGASIAGSLTSSDQKDANGNFYDEYNIKLDSPQRLTFKIELPTSATKINLDVINVATGQKDATISGLGSNEAFPSTLLAGNYKIRVYSSTLGDYKLSTIDGGKVTSFVSTFPTTLDGQKYDIGSIGASGEYFPGFDLAKGKATLFDVAITSNTSNPTLYAVGLDGTGGSFLYSVGRDLAAATSGVIKDAQGNKLLGNINSLAVSDDNKIYTTETTVTPVGGLTDKLYTIDPTNNIASLVGNLPTGFVSSGDLVYDAANKRFFATSKETLSSDSLWQIPIANPAGASKIGQIGFTDVIGLDLVGGKLIGFNNSVSGSNQLSINPTSGAGTIDKVLSGISGISGAATIPTGLASTNPNPTASTPTIPTFPTSAVDAIGTKGQSLTNRTLDLTNYRGQTLKVDTVSKGDAAYTNNVGFYVVQDAIGTIKLANGSTLKPGDANYAVEAIKSAVLQAGKIDAKLGRNIVGGEIYAPVVVAQGSFSDFVSKNPTNGGGGNAIHAYFSYLGANPDNFDHFKLTAPNTFAVEDQYGGGDKDFNDLVVNMNVKIA